MHQSDRGNLPFIVLKLEHFADKEKCIFKSEFFKKKKKKKKNLPSQSSSQAISASSSALNTTHSCNSSLPWLKPAFQMVGGICFSLALPRPHLGCSDSSPCSFTPTARAFPPLPAPTPDSSPHQLLLQSSTACWHGRRRAEKKKEQETPVLSKVNPAVEQPFVQK